MAKASRLEALFESFHWRDLSRREYDTGRCTLLLLNPGLQENWARRKLLGDTVGISPCMLASQILYRVLFAFYYVLSLSFLFHPSIIHLSLDNSGLTGIKPMGAWFSIFWFDFLRRAKLKHFKLYLRSLVCRTNSSMWWRKQIDGKVKVEWSGRRVDQVLYPHRACTEGQPGSTSLLSKPPRLMETI